MTSKPDDNVQVEILPLTPLVEMVQRTHYKRLYDVLGLADEIGVDRNVLDLELTRLVQLSTRAKFDDILDFELFTPGDTTETLRAKVLGYLNSTQLHVVEAVGQLILDYDRPFDEDLAPEPPGDADPNA